MGTQRYSSWVLERIQIGECHRLRVGINSVGRHSSSLIRILDSHYVSRHHAEVEVSLDDQAVTIKDLNSVNGVFVNNALHKSATVTLSKGDSIGIGVSIHCSEEEDELTLPIYELKYSPITRGKAGATPAQQQTKKESDNTPSTSRQSACPKPTPIEEEILVISDDDEDGAVGVKGDRDPGKPKKLDENKNKENKTNEPKIASLPMNISIKKEKLDANEQKPKQELTSAVKPKETTTSENKDKPLSKDKEVVLPSAKGKECENENVTSCNNTKEKERLPQHNKQNDKPTTSAGNIKEPNVLHIPIISDIKQERIRSVSADVQNIFGELDDDQKNKLKEINPLVYNDLSGKPLLPTTNVDSHFLNGECITLSDDEAPVEEEELGVIIPNTSKNPDNEKPLQRDTAKSPNIFNTSLNDSLEDNNSNALEVLKMHLNEKKTKEESIANDNVDLEDYTSYEPHSDDEDIEEFMFSQVLINDMKAELQDDFDNDSEDSLPPQPQENQDEPMLPIKIKEEPDLERNATLLNELENSCWVISDDEDYDQELETKVSGWSSKIFSQSYNCNNQSQVYDLDISDEDDEANKDDLDAVDLDIVEDDIDDIANLYNSNNDIQDVSFNEEQVDGKENAAKESNEGELNKAEEDCKVLKPCTVSIKRLEDLKDLEQIASKAVEEKKAPEEEDPFDEEKQLSEEEDPFDEKKPSVREDPSDVLKKLGNLDNEIREKSPDDIKEENLQTDSPIIRSRRKSITKCKPVPSSSSSEDEFEKDTIPEKPPTTTAAEQPSGVTTHHKEEDEFEKDTIPEKPPTTTAAEQPSGVTTHHKEKSTHRPRPEIINAPSLPKHKGKLRGVSAEKSPHASTKHSKLPALPKKLNSIREQMRNEEINKVLKRKWTEKPSIGKKRDKERMEIIKECRKDKLKQLADKHISPTKDKDNLKRKSSTHTHEETNAKKAKVKVTTHNRGAFLAAQNEAQIPAPPAHKPKAKEAAAFKIPKVVNKKPEETPKEPLKRSNSTEDIKKKEPPKRSASIDCGFTTFSQEISKADHLLLKKPETKTTFPHKRPAATTPPTPTITTASHYEGPSAVCKEAAAARALRTTNKITFASMERNIIESEKNKNKLNSICNKRCNKLDDITSILCPPNCGGSSKKKTVRFNDTPIIHYIERVHGARKVVAKDILPMTTHKDRRHMIRRTYPIIDNTEKIISQILVWSDEWLVKRNAAADAAIDIVYPMPTQFSSFDHYKSIMFPLMKLEFVSLLERQYNLASNVRKYKVTLEYVTVNIDRLMLVTKFNYQNRQHLESSKYDLVILESNRMNTNMFAYLTSTRKGAGSCNTMVFEIVPKNITKDFFIGIHELTVRPVVDNVRVEFGAFNAVYQLEATPLFHKILNPLELLQCRHPAKKKVIYRGFDQLNDKQRQVLLNTYVRIIDESTPNVSLLQGPPGTGKSCVIVNLALQTMYGDEVRCMDKKILICAQSNAAVDVIASKLYDISMRMRPERRFRLVRYGLQDKINPFVFPVTLQHIIEQEQMKKAKATNPDVPCENKENLKSQMLQLEAQIADMTKRNIKGTVEEDMLLEKQKQLQLMRNISNQFTRPEDERSIATWYLNNANIVCATLSSCVKLSQYVNYFDICIIDEATQCTEPWTLLPLRFGINSLVLVGDTQQLPATILSKKANELGLGKSMFTRIQNCLDNVPCSATTNGGAASNGAITPDYIICGLQTQYRMNPEICKWPNQYFYRNELINGRITMEYKSSLMPFSVLNLAYTQNDSCTNGKITNNLEAEFVAKLLKALDGFIPNKYNSYGVITPYAHHRTTLEHSIRSLGLTNIMVNTIDSYQGLEKDVIVISNARTNGIGFLANPQRLNVALTRPKKCLILCGNFKNLEVVPAWRCLLQSARERNLYHEISTNCVNDIQTNVIDKIRIKK